MVARRETDRIAPLRGRAAEGRSGYHHGDLRRVLLEAAAAVIEAEGLEALSLRAISSRAGVSHAAPYRHFADKEALVGALAEAGFDELREGVARAAARGADPGECLVEGAVAYVEFAARRPGRYEVMFRSPRTGAAAAVAASDLALRGLASLIEAAQAAGRLPSSNTDDMARAAWSLVHGLAELARTDRLALQGNGDLERLTRMAARALIEGLAER